MTSTQSTPAVPTASPEARSPLYSALIGLATLGVLLQGVWAGLFLGKPGGHGWVEVHQVGGQVSAALAIVAAIVAFLQLRARRDLVVGSVVFAVLLVAEVGLGSALGSAPGLLAVHIPLAMALLGLAVWLPLRARSRG